MESDEPGQGRGVGHLLVDRPRHRRVAALLRFAVAGLTFLFVIALAGLVVVEVRPSWLSGLRNAPSGSLHAGPASPSHGTRPSGRTGNLEPGRSGGATGGAVGSREAGAGRAGTGGSQATATGGAGGAPVLASLRPTAGRAGQRLELIGHNLFSPDGRLKLTFAGHPAPVRCPTEERCIVTVPRLGGHPRTTPVALLTAGGRSNVLAFAYHA